MGRPARFIPENKDGALVETTGRTLGARVLLVTGTKYLRGSTPLCYPFRSGPA